MDQECPEREGPPAEEPEERFITLRLGSSWFGFLPEQVREIFPVQRMTRVPNAPPEITGLVDWRGRPVAVCDLHRSLGITADRVGRAGFSVVVEVPDTGVTLAMLAEEVGEVRRKVTAMDAAEAGTGGPVHDASQEGSLEVYLPDLAKIASCLQPGSGDVKRASFSVGIFPAA